MKGCCCGVGECCRACHGNPLQTPRAARSEQGEWFRPDGTLANQAEPKEYREPGGRIEGEDWDP